MSSRRARGFLFCIHLFLEQHLTHSGYPGNAYWESLRSFLLQRHSYLGNPIPLPLCDWRGELLRKPGVSECRRVRGQFLKANFGQGLRVCCRCGGEAGCVRKGKKWRRRRLQGQSAIFHGGCVLLKKTTTKNRCFPSIPQNL